MWTTRFMTRTRKKYLTRTRGLGGDDSDSDSDSDLEVMTRTRDNLDSDTTLVHIRAFSIAITQGLRHNAKVHEPIRGCDSDFKDAICTRRN